ncbi:MAG: transposase [Actinomycetes bacterium]
MGRSRGLSGVQLVISDAHKGLRAAIRRVFQGAAWQRCRVHAACNLLSHCKAAHRGMVAALIRTIFAQPDGTAARTQLRAVVTQLEGVEPKVAALLEGMEDDLLASATFPSVHWPKIWSNNPIERLNRELKRRTDVVQIFPDPESVIRLVGALLCEVNDELVVLAPRRYMAQATLTDLTPDEEDRLPSLPAVTARQPRRTVLHHAMGLHPAEPRETTTRTYVHADKLWIGSFSRTTCPVNRATDPWRASHASWPGRDARSARRRDAERQLVAEQAQLQGR